MGEYYTKAPTCIVSSAVCVTNTLAVLYFVGEYYTKAPTCIVSSAVCVTNTLAVLYFAGEYYPYMHCVIGSVCTLAVLCNNWHNYLVEEILIHALMCIV